MKMKLRKLTGDYDGGLEERIRQLEGAFDEILKANSITTIKELAAEALDVDVDDYLIDEFDIDSLSDGEDDLDFGEEDRQY